MSSYLLPYKIGLASFTNGSKVVTGALTAWTGNAKPGDLWQGPDGLLYAISAAPITNTRLELVNDYAGATASGQPYQIHRVSSGWGETSDVNLRVADLLKALKANTLSSVSEIEIGTGEKVFSVQSGYPISPGARVTAANPADPDNYMSGTVTAYEGTSLTVDVQATGGSGTFSEWNINFAGSAGPKGEGEDGWSPVFAVVGDGDRRVLQVQSWTGGTGTPPASGSYVGATGFVPDIADAVDIRGAPGIDGDGAGSVTQIDTGAGLTGGPITGSGTIDIDMVSLDEETSPASDDLFLMQRPSDGALFHVKAENLPGSGGGGGGRELLTAPRTYYVNGTTGSDSNDGLTSGTAFATIQKGVDATAGLDLGIYDVTVSIANGTYTQATILKPLVGAGRCYIVGDEGNPANVVVSAPSDTTIYGVSLFSIYHLRGVRLGAASGARCLELAGNGTVFIRNIDFSAGGFMHISSTNGSSIIADGDYSISGGASYHWNASAGLIEVVGFTITLTGTPAFGTTGAQAFAAALRGGAIVVPTTTYVGAATGRRYNAVTNGIIDANGATLPGSVAGTVATGGVFN